MRKICKWSTHFKPSLLATENYHLGIYLLVIRLLFDYNMSKCLILIILLILKSSPNIGHACKVVNTVLYKLLDDAKASFAAPIRTPIQHIGTIHTM